MKFRHCFSKDATAILIMAAIEPNLCAYWGKIDNPASHKTLKARRPLSASETFFYCRCW
jgi:hypothetical protein